MERGEPYVESRPDQGCILGLAICCFFWAAVLLLVWWGWM